MESLASDRKNVNDLTSTITHSLATVEGQRAVWLGSPGVVRFEAVGEAHRPREIQRVVAAVQGRLDAPFPAWLIPEPQNSHDANAVMVWAFGGHVGYLSAEMAAGWSAILIALSRRHGARSACQATLDPPSAANQGGWGIAIWLPQLPLPHASPSSAVAPQSMADPSTSGAVVSATLRDNAPLRPAPAKPAEISPEALAALKVEVDAAKRELAEARSQLASVEEGLELQSFGFYRPRYGFDSSVQYTLRLKKIRDEQQALIKADTAASCETVWKVGGSAAAGKKMVKQQAKLMLRAFNGECDAAVAKVRYDNVSTLEQRMSKAYADINKLGEVQQVFISRRYFDLKLAELHLVHEHREKVQEEKEEQKRIKEQMREEQKALEEIDRAKSEAEKEEAQKTVALDKAKAELALAEATSKQHDKLESLVTRLETELKDALDRNEPHPSPRTVSLCSLRADLSL